MCCHVAAQARLRCNGHPLVAIGGGELPLQHHFRDAHVITQYAFVSASRYDSVGKLIFGLDTDWGPFGF